mmetsp:Transcript_8900/g.16363  ORF Transcript_8900/g.16363 Transcript_8900/m.16363 type:complete len:421 (-) Transcript_8900:634-1896(-)
MTADANPGGKQLLVDVDVPLKAIGRPGLSFFEAFQSTVKAIIGTGVLALPHAFQLSGGVFGPILLVSIALYTIHINLLLTQCYKMRPSRGTYSGLCESVLGRAGKYIGGFNLIIMQIFVCAAHFVFIGRNVSSALNSWGYDATMEKSVILTAFGISGFTLLRDLSILKNTSLLGNLAVLVSLISIIVYAVPNFDVQNLPISTSVGDIAVFFSMSIYMFNGIGEVLPISKSMQDRDEYPKVLAATFMVLVSSYLAFGIVVSASFGSSTQGLVFDNLDGGVVAFVKIFHAIAVFCTIPLKYFSAINDGLIPLIEDCFSVDLTNGSQSSSCASVMVALKFGMVALSVVITLTVPDFAFLVSLVGGFSITICAFILPPLMFQILALDPLNKVPAWRQITNGCLLSFGVLMCLYVTIRNITTKFL